MNTSHFRLLLFTCFLTSVLNVSLAHSRNDKIALVYNGPGACYGCAESFVKVLKPLGFRIKFVSPSEMTKKVFDEASLYVQPGGTDRLMDTLEVLTADQIQNLRNFVSTGGRYLGTCAGGYLATAYTYDEGRIIPAFGLLPFNSMEESENPAPVVEPIKWLDESRKIYFQDGPYFQVRPSDSIQIVARYENTNHVAALISVFGLGKVGVIGPHPEADSDWYKEDGLEIPEKLSLDLAGSFVTQLMK
jgi:glutamine amidotransferase-like uncharacterized protein